MNYDDLDNTYSKALLRSGRVAPEAWPMSNAQMIRVERLRSNPRNPRLTFDEKALQELGQSMLTVGIIEPLVVRYVGGRERAYEIIVGERRWRAAKKVHIPELPCLVREVDDLQAFEMALSENVLREELTPVDEGKSYRHMLDMGMANSLRDIARKIGVSHTRVQQKINLLSLEHKFQRSVATRVASPKKDQKITEGHARHLLRLSSPEKRQEVFDLILENDWSTRETASHVARQLKNSSARHRKRLSQTNPDVLAPTTEVESTRRGFDIRIQCDDSETLVRELETLLHLAKTGALNKPDKAQPIPKET